MRSPKSAPLFLLFLCLSVPIQARSGFTLLSPADTGLSFTNALPEQRHLTNQILLNGSGVAAGDVDGDGRCDLYFARIDGSNALYRNLGNWKFEEIAQRSGVALPNGASTGCALLDLDGDSDLDLVVNSLGQGAHIFYNNGKGEFRPHSVLNPGKGGMSLAAGDLDGDGFLDLYIANYRTQGLMDVPNARATFKRVDGRTLVETFNGRPATAPDLTNRFSISPRGAIEENGEADVIYRNVGGTNFVAMPWTGGNFLDENGQPLAREFYDWGLAAAIRDLDGDGLPDIYVCNDFQTPDRLWLNQGGGKFRLAPRETQRKTSMFSMSVDFADLDRDGFDDFFVADMLSRSHAQRMRDMTETALADLWDRPQYSLNTLFRNRGDGTFAEIARYSGIDASDWTWSSVFLDVDLDGWEDMLVSNGMERAARDLDVAARLKAMRAARPMTDAEIFQARRMFPRLATRNAAFRNRGDLTFEDSSDAWGFNLAGVSHGLALADLDGDGDLDAVLNNLNAPAALYRNESDAARVGVRLKSAGPNTHGIGARITVRGGAVPLQTQTMIAGARYLSSDEPLRAFAAGASASVTVEVVWPSGRRSEAQAKPGETITMQEPMSDAPIPRARPPALAAMFEDVSARLAFEHKEDDFDDYARQALLPRKLSAPGPAAAWCDLDGDGWDDLALGASRGGSLAVFRNLRNGSFQPVEAAVLKSPAQREIGALLGWRGAPGRGFLLAGLCNYEDGLASGAAVRQIDVIGNTGADIAPGAESSAGAIALGDIDHDGDLDVFIAGRCIPGKYPLAASSRLFRNNGSRLEFDTANERVLEGIGLVSSAVFSDIDNDKDLDLVLACEWGPVRILRNDKGAFEDATSELGLASLQGWWNGLAVADFDGDGRMDIAAGNWGLNTSPKPTAEHPLRIYHGDLDGDGAYDVIEAHYDAETKGCVPARHWPAVSKSLDFVRESFPSNAAYSTATIEMLLGARLEKAKVAEANTLASTVLLNRGTRFESHPLPAEAQLTPAIGLCAADFDGDGNDDLALSQNFFPLQPEVPRQDAGRGLLLRGDGKGGFAAVSGQESGIRVYGEQRAIAAADFDADGRVDLLIAQNGGPAKLFRNLLAKPGVRVMLAGSSANPEAIGASLRFRSEGRVGPRREIQSSSGWLSQNSRVQLFPATGAGQVEIRWPDGLQETVDIPAGVKQVRLKRDN